MLHQPLRRPRPNHSLPIAPKKIDAHRWTHSFYLARNRIQPRIRAHPHAALSVAIPAVFAYNIFAARLNKVEGQLESIGSELIALMVREGMI